MTEQIRAAMLILLGADRGVILGDLILTRNGEGLLVVWQRGEGNVLKDVFIIGEWSGRDALLFAYGPWADQLIAAAAAGNAGG